jgi:hypothetical protein
LLLKKDIEPPPVSRPLPVNATPRHKNSFTS